MPARTFAIDSAPTKPTALKIRVPYWALQGVRVSINGKAQAVTAAPSSYLSLNSAWKAGDIIAIDIPMTLHLNTTPDDKQVQAAMYGPLVLAGRFEAVSRDQKYGTMGPRGTESKVPDLIAKSADASSTIEPDPKPPLDFHAVGQSEPITLVPLNRIFRERYAVYWKVKNV